MKCNHEEVLVQCSDTCATIGSVRPSPDNNHLAVLFLEGGSDLLLFDCLSDEGETKPWSQLTVPAAPVEPYCCFAYGASFV